MFLQKAMRYYRLWIYSCNLALLLSVMVFVALSAWILSDPKMSLIRSITFYHPTFIYAYFALAFQGGILQAIGCIGALRMHERLLNTYWTAMLVLLVGDAIVGIAWIFHYHHLTASLRNDLKIRLQADYGTDTPFQLLWDQIQIQSGCCGVDGPQDFNASAWRAQQRKAYPQHHQVVPRSCCQMYADPTIGEEVPVNYTCVETYVGEFVHQTGCYDAVRWWLQHSADILSVLGFCVIAFLKVCFLGILRYEIREMIQKIQILKTMSEPPPLIGGLETNIPKATASPTSGEAPRDAHIGNCVTPQLSPDTTQSIKESQKPPNGNNNDTEFGDAKKYSAV